MKTVVKIDPEKEYASAKKIIESLLLKDDNSSEIPILDESVDNLKTVINVLIERATPKPRVKPPKKTKKQKNKKPKPRIDFDKLPSDKFPELKVEENIIKSPEIPVCPYCEEKMKESGLYKTSEKLEVNPKQYYIVRNKRVIYNCNNCHGSMVNAPSLPSISSSSNYGDSIIIDAALSKYCDLIPMERYSAIASREGVAGLAPNSLISLTHSLASYLSSVYENIKEEVLSSLIILADETPHKMLEGDDTANWYLWGFSSKNACIFETHGTRSGNVPLKFLLKSDAVYLLTDGYGGYKRALRELKEDGKTIIEVYCNSHAFRYFKDASVTWKEEVTSFLKLYGEIYKLEKNAVTEQQKLLARKQMLPLFTSLKSKCEEIKDNVMVGSGLEKAVNYFLNHYEGLTVCLKNIDIPLDNNFSERLLRSPVIGRKTWYGTHSKRGARTSAILFSIVETCKINNINPRNYFSWVVKRIQSKEAILTPYQYSKL